jgi:hypothetical protein
MARQVRVLRSFGIPGIATAQAGEVIALENEAIEYLLQYDTVRPLIDPTPLVWDGIVNAWVTPHETVTVGQSPEAQAPAASGASNPLYGETDQ